MIRKIIKVLNLLRKAGQLAKSQILSRILQNLFRIKIKLNIIISIFFYF